MRTNNPELLEPINNGEDKFFRDDAYKDEEESQEETFNYKELWYYERD